MRHTEDLYEYLDDPAGRYGCCCTCGRRYFSRDSGSARRELNRHLSRAAGPEGDGGTDVVNAIYYDTEFLEDGRTIELISIGMVRESDGAELYLVNADLPARRIRKHQWLMDNVVPSLPHGHGDWRNHMPKRWLVDYYDHRVVPKNQIAVAVERFILQEPEPELWASYGAYDHVVLCQLWGAMVDLPAGVPMWTNDLQQEWLRLGKPDLPEQAGGFHNALADARHCRVVAEHLRGLS